MSRVMAVCRREFASYFQTPSGYVVTGIFALLAGLGFSISLLAYARISQAPAENGYATVPDFEETFLGPWLVYCGLLIMFLSPLLTMRLFAEERHRGTIELLFTLPLRDRDIVFGKYLAGLAMLMLMMGVIAVDLGIVAWLVTIEVPVLVMGVVTVFLMGAAFLALGMFVSSMMRNQVTSGAVTFGLCLLLFIMGSLGEKLPATNPAPATWPAFMQSTAGAIYGVVRGMAAQLSVDAHANDMAQGIVGPADFAYYLLFIAFFIFLTFRVLESRHWRA
jgi:ABC-2 type transport system permease protein